MLFPTFHESQLMPWSTPQEINGSDVSFTVHVDETLKMTWVGHEKNGQRRTWVPLAEALYHNFYKIVALCRTKDLPEQCLLQTPSYKFEFMRLMNNKMRQFLQGKYGVCILIESLPSLSSGDIYRYAPGKLGIKCYYIPVGEL